MIEPIVHVKDADADADGWSPFAIVAAPDWVEPTDSSELHRAVFEFEPFSSMPRGTIVQFRNFEYHSPGCFFGRFSVKSPN